MSLERGENAFFINDSFDRQGHLNRTGDPDVILLIKPKYPVLRGANHFMHPVRHRSLWPGCAMILPHWLIVGELVSWRFDTIRGQYSLGRASGVKPPMRGLAGFDLNPHPAEWPNGQCFVDSSWADPNDEAMCQLDNTAKALLYVNSIQRTLATSTF